MPNASLHPHPSHAATAAYELNVDLDWHNALITLRYRLQGPLDSLRIAPPAAPERTDELWRHTCFELFLTAPELAGYCEFNFSPSAQWAAYRFDAYRSGMRPVEGVAPQIVAQLNPGQLDVQVALSLHAVPILQEPQELSCAVTAVLEDTAGTRSYWALRHPAGQPDFHHRDGFVLRLRRITAL